ncbi:MAG: hypothetical protein IIY78_06410 [Clostridia bacterium]|nr:hypothetical protein [Clostridia bacterium]
MESTRRKSYKVSLSDEEYQYVMQAANDAGLPFSAYAMECLMNRTVQGEAPLRQSLARLLPQFTNILYHSDNDKDMREELKKWGNKTWQLLR